VNVSGQRIGGTAGPEGAAQEEDAAADQKNIQGCSHFLEFHPVLRIQIRNPVLFDHWILIRVKFLPDPGSSHIF
jgi:hypothetical protein